MIRLCPISVAPILPSKLTKVCPNTKAFAGGGTFGFDVRMTSNRAGYDTE